MGEVLVPTEEQKLFRARGDNECKIPHHKL
jgi:hypothetical protein